MIWGIKCGHGEPDRQEMSPLTRDSLLWILQKLRQPLHTNHTLKAALSLAFVEFLEVEEFTYQPVNLELRLNFQNWFLTKISNKISRDQSHISIYLPSSKMEPFYHMVEIIILATGEVTCSLSATYQFLGVDTNRQPLTPLFVPDPALSTHFT